MKDFNKTTCIAAALICGVVCNMALATGRNTQMLVFASEKIMGKWVGSFFDTTLKRDTKFNECELAVSREMEKVESWLFNETDENLNIEDARRFKIVFDRYADLSAIPNDTAAKAALLINNAAEAVAMCAVNVSNKKNKTLCAFAGCKVVDVQTKKRIAFAKTEKCVKPENETDLIGAACEVVAKELAAKIYERYQ